MYELPEDIVELILKSCKGTLLEEECCRLEKWMADTPECKEAVEMLNKCAIGGIERKRFHEIDTHAAWRQIDSKTRRRPGWYIQRMKSRWWIAAAMMIPCIIGLVLYNLIQQGKEPVMNSIARVEPGSFKAILEFPGRDRVLLADVQEREIMTESGSVLAKDSVHTLFVHGKKTGGVEHGKIQVPFGGEYRVVLSDGTKVWINSGSVLKFPTAFEEGERVVELQGEAYFDVTRDSRRPFIVRTERSAIRVLGTSFNVCSYSSDEYEQTTLVDGAVEVLHKDLLYRLIPGEQFEILGGIKKVKSVDVNLYTSWQEGIFRFQDMPLDELTVKLQRWYNVNFFFSNEDCRKYRFTGAIRKDVDFSEFISLIERVTHVQFDVKGDVIVISKK